MRREDRLHLRGQLSLGTTWREQTIDQLSPLLCQSMLTRVGTVPRQRFWLRLMAVQVGASTYVDVGSRHRIEGFVRPDAVDLSVVLGLVSELHSVGDRAGNRPIRRLALTHFGRRRRSAHRVMPFNAGDLVMHILASARISDWLRSREDATTSVTTQMSTSVAPSSSFRVPNFRHLLASVGVGLEHPTLRQTLAVRLEVPTLPVRHQQLQDPLRYVGGLRE